MNFFEKYKIYKKIKKEQKYNFDDFQSYKLFQKLHRFINISTTISFLLTILFLLTSIFTIFGDIYIDPNIILFGTASLIFISFLSFAIQPLILSFLYKKKVNNMLKKDLEKIYKNYPLKEIFNQLNIFKKDFTDENVKNIIIDINYMNIDHLTFFKNEIKSLNEEFLIKNHTDLISFLSKEENLKNSMPLFEFLFSEYEKYLNKEIINLNTFYEDLKLISKSIFNNVKLYSESKNYLDDYIESYKELNDIQYSSNFNNKEKVCF